ncbi:MAG: hypothetical protein LBK40_06075, partial [Spirochaetaceae bacterium]|nr:hypothetical protein [Spirochaetaceae bacterium]
MSKSTDWLPNSREEQIIMARKWLKVFNEETEDAQGTTVKKYVAWGIPLVEFTLFGTLYGEAQTALTAAQNEETRTPVANARCRTAFDALNSDARDLKKRHFFVPPLTDADLVSLGLKIPDPGPTPSGNPTAQVTLETFLVGRHELGVRILYVTGNPDDAANKGYRIWYSVVEPGETPPTDPEQLTKSFYTKRKKDRIEFGFGDSGKTVYFAVQIENDG